MKILNDLLKSPNGKYSRKSFYGLVTFVYVLGLGVYVTITNGSTGVFDSMLIFLGTLILSTIADKKLLNKSVLNTSQEETLGTEI